MSTSIGLNEGIFCRKNVPKCNKKCAQKILKMGKKTLEMVRFYSINL
jgi:hypothetical protein